ncbi:MAG: hypothetical protein JST70_15230 [Bacteroidetes bacterium]|nr:hypothetical protein [Bacteroidota bacterium]
MDPFDIFGASGEELLAISEFYRAYPEKLPEVERIALLLTIGTMDDTYDGMQLAKAMYDREQSIEPLVLYASTLKRLEYIDDVTYKNLQSFISVTENKKIKAVLLLLTAYHYYNGKESPQEYLNIINQSIELDETLVMGYWELHWYYKSNNEPEKAIPHLIKAISFVEKIFDPSDRNRMRVEYPDFFSFESFYNRNVAMRHLAKHNYQHLVNSLNKLTLNLQNN